MKQLYISLFTALTLIGLGSCSTYRSSTTPDDVYGSQGVSNDGYSNYSQGNSDYYSTPNDNYVRMRVQDPNRWSTFDDNNYDYYGGGYSNLGYASPYSYGLGYGGYGGYGGLGFGYNYNPFFGTGLSLGYGLGYGYGMGYYDNYYLWNSYYNPYYGHVVVVNGHNAASTPVTRAANFNPASYRGRSVSTRPAFSSRSASSGQIFSPNNAASSRRANYYNNNATNSGNNYNRPSNNSRPAYNNTYSRPAQTQTYSQPVRSAPSNFGGGSSGGGGGRAGGMSRPGR